MTQRFEAGNAARTVRLVYLRWSFGVAALMLSAAAATAADKGTPAENTVQQKSASAAVSGEEIFRREWLADDPRSHGGDGLGPVFNESSCVACHNQGGTGGGGPVGKNVQLVTFSILDLNRLKTR